MRPPDLQDAVQRVANVNIPETLLAARLGPNRFPTAGKPGEGRSRWPQYHQCLSLRRTGEEAQ